MIDGLSQANDLIGWYGMRDKWHRIGRRLTRDGFSLAYLPPPSPPFVTCPRLIFARVQDGAGDGELRVFLVFCRDKNTHKPPVL